MIGRRARPDLLDRHVELIEMSTDPIEAPSVGAGDGEVAVTETADAIDLDLYPNEASDLAVVPGGLVAGYDQAFVTVLDEGVIEDSVALLGHRGDDPFGGWEAQRL